MKWFCLFSIVVLSSPAIRASDDGPGSGEQRANVTTPPVLKKCEPSDSVVFTLPGAPRAVASTAASSSVLPFTEVRLAPPPADPERPVLHRSQHEYPPEFELDSGDFLNQQIGIWRQIDAQELLGESTGQRPAYADDRTVNGQILSFPDPTGRYKQLELDFDRETGLLRTLFLYPQNLTWQDCRKTFGTDVRATPANKGRTFYSYMDRRLDVLVDPAGKVISLGMY